jgi:hypothetical protein
MWIHFESIHIIQQPTYMSKYPPAQGLFLAVGQILTGYPIVGAWISMALMSAAIVWMLQVWSSRRWALLGGLLVIIHPELGIGGYWAQSYWGGAVATTGGALVLGGLRSVMRKPTVTAALVLGAGVAILANSRPYEGLLLALPAAVTLLYWLFSNSGPVLRVAIQKILLPLLLILSLTAVAMAFYNSRTTGSVFRMAYQVHEETYGVVPLFVWQNLRPVPHYHHEVLKKFHLAYGIPNYQEKQSVIGLLEINFAVWMMYFLLAGSVVALPLIGAARILVTWMMRDPWARFAILTYFFFGLGIAIQTYSNLHYFAPVIPINYVFIVQAMRLWRWRSRRLGNLMLWIVPALSIAVLSINVIWPLLKHSGELSFDRQRAELLERLKKQVGRHLILVNYGPGHAFESEWVYNQADIDASTVVWARDMGGKKNCELINYYKDRTIWSIRIDDDQEPVKLSPYSKDTCIS